MASPVMVEVIRDMPVTSDPSICMENIANNNNSGYPFDDTDEDGSRDRSFRTHLDDIAKRHPEFADHLQFGNDFPFRSQTWGQKRRGSATAGEDRPSSSHNDPFTEHRRFTDRPFVSRFEQFGFPFSRRFKEDPEFFEEQPKQHASTAQPRQEQEQEVHQEPKHKPPESPTERGRKQNPNLPQSNTVDLGQKQVPVDDNRSQRSMSAPPDHRSGQRFVSSINIPINTDGAGDMGSRTSQQQPPQQSKPNERVIPIHVEGRDEPIMPKNVHHTFSSQPPNVERVFTGQRPSHFNQFQAHRPEELHKQQQELPQQKEQPSVPPQQEAPPAHKPGPIDLIQSIQKDVLELMNQVEKFSGKPKDKEYLYLDEMLTRNLIKLDNIETEGKDNIRQARKEAIKCIESCIGILESKAAANQAYAERSELENNPSAELIASEQQQHGEIAEVVHAPLTNLEVSGEVRAGKEVEESASEPTATEASPESKDAGEPKVDNIAETEADIPQLETEGQATPAESKNEKSGDSMDIAEQSDAKTESNTSQPKEEKRDKKKGKKEKTERK